MMLSLLETIVVMHLMSKDSQDEEEDGGTSDSNKLTEGNFHYKYNIIAVERMRDTFSLLQHVHVIGLSVKSPLQH